MLRKASIRLSSALVKTVEVGFFWFHGSILHRSAFSPLDHGLGINTIWQTELLRSPDYFVLRGELSQSCGPTV